jgi:hypothetical protein
LPAGSCPLRPQEAWLLRQTRGQLPRPSSSSHQYGCWLRVIEPTPLVRIRGISGGFPGGRPLRQRAKSLYSRGPLMVDIS